MQVSPDVEPSSIIEKRSAAQNLIDATLAVKHGGVDANNALKWLHQFSASPRPYSSCFYILEEISVEEKHEQAFFYALIAIRHALVREWSIIQSDDINTIRSRIERFTLERALLSSISVTKTALQLLAMLHKRFWFSQDEEENSATLIAQIHNLLVPSTASLNSQRLALLLCQALLSEFCTSKGSSAINMRWETHVRCHRSLEKWFLQDIFVTVCTWLSANVLSTENTVEYALDVLLTILSWEFDEHISSRRLALRITHSLNISAAPSSAFEALKPGSRWTKLLIDNDSVQCLMMQLYTHVRSRASEASLVRHVLLRLCCLRGRVFPVTDEEVQNGVMRKRFVGRMVAIVLRLAYHALHDTTSSSVTELLDIATFFYRLVENFRLPLLLSASCEDDVKGIMHALSELSLRALPLAYADELDTRGSECFDIATDCWTSLLTQCEQHLSSLPHSFLSELSVHTEKVLCAFVREHLQRAHHVVMMGNVDDETSNQFYDSSHTNEQMASVALLARPCATRSFPMLTSALCERTASLRKLVSEVQINQQQLALLHEELLILLQILGCAIADEIILGEIMLPPKLLLASDIAVQVSAASNALIAFVALENEMLRTSSATFLLSPLVAEIALEVVGRWVVAYVDRIDDNHLLHIVIEHISLCLFDFSNEWSVAECACRLLISIVGIKSLHNRLQAISVWNDFFTLCTSSEMPILQRNLCGNIITLLSRALCKFAIGFASTSADKRQSCFRAVTIPPLLMLKHRVANISSVTVMNAEFQAELIVLLEYIRGIALTSGRLAVNIVFDALQSVLGEIVSIIRVSGQAVPVLRAALDVLVDFASSSIVHMSETQANVFFSACLEAVRSFGEVHAQRLSMISNGVRASVMSINEDEDLLEDIVLLLKLLSHISSKDLFDFGPDAVLFSSDAAFMGVKLLLPHLTLQALQFPRVCMAFYDLITELVSTYPDKFSALDAHTQANLLQAIEFAINSPQVDIVRGGLQVLKVLADFSCETKLSGKHESLRVSIVPFQRNLLHTLLFVQIDSSLLDPLADALMPLIRINVSEFHTLLSSIVMEQNDPAVRERLSQAFNKLALGGVDDGTMVQSRNRFQFRDVTRFFVEEMRPFLQSQ